MMLKKIFLYVILPEDGMFTLSEVKEKLSECMKGEGKLICQVEHGKRQDKKRAGAYIECSIKW